MRGLAFFCREAMETLSSSVKEVAMDATFGTNNAGMDLFALLAEVDGTGVPLGYCFVEVNSGEGNHRSDRGALPNILTQFLGCFRRSGLRPAFFGIDKDFSEISAVKQVFPDVKVQLCFWHAKRAIRQKIRDATKTCPQAKYSPAEAQAIIPGLEVCWGSVPTRRPHGDHFFGRCQCPSRMQRFEEKGRVETSTAEERDAVLAMFCRHFNAHPSIPDRNGTLRTPEAIHSEACSELYAWCKARDYFRLWSYMFVNWYRPEQWKLWARSANPSEIPVLKTTMIIESHWRKVKHDFLHRFNRPRIDLVVWILTSRVVPAALARLKAIQTRNYRMATSSWRKDFKKEWKELSNRIVEEQSYRQHHTDPQKWVCGCESFIGSRFLICKHLVHCFEPVPRPLEFFQDIRRRRSSPYWVSSQLVLRSEFASSTEQASTEVENSVSSSECSEMESDIEEAARHEDDLVDLSEAEDPDLGLEQFFSNNQRMLDLVREQHAKGNDKFVEKVVKANQSNKILVDEISQLRASRTIPCTWSRRSHPATIYYK